MKTPRNRYMLPLTFCTFFAFEQKFHKRVSLLRQNIQNDDHFHEKWNIFGSSFPLSSSRLPSPMRPLCIPGRNAHRSFIRARTMPMPSIYKWKEWKTVYVMQTICSRLAIGIVSLKVHALVKYLQWFSAFRGDLLALYAFSVSVCLLCPARSHSVFALPLSVVANKSLSVGRELAPLGAAIVSFLAARC